MDEDVPPPPVVHGLWRTNESLSESHQAALAARPNQQTLTEVVQDPRPPSARLADLDLSVAAAVAAAGISSPSPGGSGSGGSGGGGSGGGGGGAPSGPVAAVVDSTVSSTLTINDFAPYLRSIAGPYADFADAAAADEEAQHPPSVSATPLPSVPAVYFADRFDLTAADEAPQR